MAYRILVMFCFWGTLRGVKARGSGLEEKGFWSKMVRKVFFFPKNKNPLGSIVWAPLFRELVGHKRVFCCDIL